MSVGRLLGVDYGGTRTGLALSDVDRVTCRPLGVIEEQGERLVSTILQTVREHDAVGVVVGVPRPLAGGTNRQLEIVLSFVAELGRESRVPVETWDERFTTALAESGRGASGPRDDVAACYMLQNYLDGLSAAEREAE